jgi:PAS domain S-box-containing protein
VDNKDIYREMVQSVNSIIMRWNTDLQVTFINDYAHRFFGYAREELLGKSVIGTIVPEMSLAGKNLEEMIEDISLNPDRYVINENENVRKNGERVWVSWTNKPIYDEKGRVVEILAVGNDITDRKRAEEALHRNEERYRRIVEDQTEFICRFRPDGTITFVNDAYCRYFSVKREDLMGHNFWPFICEEDRDTVKKSILSLNLENPLITLEERVILPDGRLGWQEWKNRMIFDDKGNFIEIQAVGLDITERKLAEMELERTNRALKAISRCNEAMIHAQEEFSLLKNICNIIVDLGGYRMAWIGYAMNDDARTIKPVARAGYEHGYLEKARITWADTERGRGPTGTAVRTKKPFVIKYVTTDPNFSPWREEALRMGYNSVIGLPLIIDDDAPGVLTIYSEKPDAFDKDEIILLSELADNLAYGIISIRSSIKREEAEDKLRLSEERFRATFEQAAVGVVHTGIDGHFIRVNRKMCDITGYSREELLQLTYMEITFPDDIEKDLVNTKKLTDGLIPLYSTEKRYIRKDGSPVHVSITSSLFRKNGQPQYYITIIQDITERKRAEEALRVNEARLRRTRQILYRSQEAGKVGSWYLDLKRNYLWWSPETYKMYGIPPGTRLDYEAFLATVHEEDIDFVDRAWKAAVAGGTYDIEHRVRVGGDIKWMQEKAILEFDEKGVPVYGIGTVLDITERKCTEEEMREREAKLDSILRAAPVGIGVVVDRIIKEANKGLCEMTGYMRDELIGQDARMLYPTDADYDFVGKEKYRLIAEYGTGSLETRWKCKDGRIISILLSSTPIDINDLSAGVTFTALDITERKVAEEALKEAKDQAELYVDLMGHDINNMNQIAAGFLELAVNKLDNEGRLEKSDRMLLEKPIETLMNNSQLIDNVRKIKKEKAGEIKPTIVDIGKMLQEAAAQYSHVSGRDITIDHEPVSGCYVMANELLKDVFTNLVGNAIKHSKGPLNIKMTLTGSQKNGRKYYRVDVEDNGPGIPDGMKRKLLDQACLKRTLKTGKGFGLCLIKTLLDDFDGSIWIEDRVPADFTKGSRFVVMLPAVEK